MYAALGGEELILSTHIQDCKRIMLQRTGSAVVYVMACRQLSLKPLPKKYGLLLIAPQISITIESKYYNFHPQKAQ